MTELFLKLVSMSAAAGCLVLAVVVLRLLAQTGAEVDTMPALGHGSRSADLPVFARKRLEPDPRSGDRDPGCRGQLASGNRISNTLRYRA